MINSLKFKVTFTSNGKTIEGEHTFEKGLTSITGKNETGKSLRLEMIRYCLFGAKALRAESKTYKSLAATLKFTVGGKTYTLSRGGNKVSLKLGIDDVATGSKPVNEALIRILGYDIEVFDVANACLQGEIEALSDKTPGDRKRMVDRTIGLDALDSVIDAVTTDVSATRKALAMMQEQVLVRYEQPVKPDLATDQTVEQYEELMQSLERDLQRKNFLQGMISAAYAPEPKAGTIVPTPGTLEELEEQLGLHNRARGDIAGIKYTLDKYNTATKGLGGFNKDDVFKYIDGDYGNKWAAYNAYISRKPEEVTYTQEMIDLVVKGNGVKERNGNLLHIICPNCQQGIDASLSDGKICQLNEQDFDWTRYEELLDIFPTDKRLHEKQTALTAWLHWSGQTPIEKPDMNYMPGAEWMRGHLDVLLELNDFNPATAQTQIAEAETDWINKSKVLTDQITIKKREVADIERFNRETDAYSKYKALVESNQKELDGLKHIEEYLVQTKVECQKLRNYNDAVNKFEARQESQREALQTIAELEANLETLSRVKKALSDLKPLVKLHLIPSLNHVASNLLAQMTGGERRVIKVDENFNIEVDGDQINTLSGSGKAVANLAVRIGLGTVLTNKVFSVFLADEIDAAMDSERAEYTANCLRNLTNTIDQIILVSHKQPDADHNIQL